MATSDTCQQNMPTSHMYIYAYSYAPKHCVWPILSGAYVGLAFCSSCSRVEVKDTLVHLVIVTVTGDTGTNELSFESSLCDRTTSGTS